MAKTFILMTALPPTLGHRDIMEFGASLGELHVLLITREGEPFCDEREAALRSYLQGRGFFTRYHMGVQARRPEDLWATQLLACGFQKGDYLVSSEPWGRDLAEKLEGEFFPYDLERSLRSTRGTWVRREFSNKWDTLLPEFKLLTRKRIILFGSESVGKTTVASALGRLVPSSSAVFEYARPYLETNGPEVTLPKLENIWKGQKALQRVVMTRPDAPRHIFFDTDLFSLLGTWRHHYPEEVPPELIKDAQESRGDLYLLLKSAIPFEKDSLRTGDQRDTSDTYWEELLQEFDLPYREIPSGVLEDRLEEALEMVRTLAPPMIEYQKEED